MKKDDYFTPREIFESMKELLSHSHEKRLYRSAPSVILRKYYVLKACEDFAAGNGWVHGDKLEDIRGNFRGIMSQYEDAFSIEDWEYMASNTYDIQYRYACKHRMEDLKARQDGIQSPEDKL